MAEQWIKGAIKHPGALREQLGAKEGETIPVSKLDSTISSLQAQAEGPKKLSAEQRTLLRRAVLARSLRKMHR